MREKWIRLWRDYRFPLMMAFGTLPVSLLIAAYYAPVLLPFLWAWPLGYVFLDALSTRIPGKWRIAYGLLETALLGASGWYGGTLADNWTFLVVPGMYCVLLLWGLVLSSEERNDRISVFWFVVSIGAHLMGQLLLYSANIMENPAPDPVRPWVTVSFFLYAILALVTLNQANLKFSTGGRQNASRLMQRKNLLLVVALFAVGMLVASVPAIVKGAGELLQWIIIGVLWLMYILSGKNDAPQGSGEEQGAVGEEGMLPPGEPGQMPQWLSVVLAVIVLALVAAVAVYAVYITVKKLIVFVKFLTRISGKYLHAVSEDYVDEISDTREGRENSERARSRKPRLSSLDEKKLPPDQRIRYRYLRLRQKHPEWDKGATARETVSPEAAPIYERVRYSSHPVTEADAQRFLAETKKHL